MEKFILLQKINVMRKCMYIKAKKHGYTHPSVVSYSQRIDMLLNRYQNIS
ncbi:MAG TPA: aspartyl-phosphate phosphatase Spo0E family protein [Sporosarcina sp.]|nr:aspartyl-phosphate phosphatase Spo0E family protein [Sporosarcina sp.]